MSALTVQIAAKGLRASRGRTLLLFAALSISSLLLGLAIIWGFAAAREGARNQTVNAEFAVVTGGNVTQPHTRWHVDHVAFPGHGSITSIDVAGSDPAAPVPTALHQIPAPGTVMVSPALRHLIDHQQFTPPGRVTGTLPRAYVESDGDLVMMTGWRYDDLVAHVTDAHKITSFDGGHGLNPNVRGLLFLIALVLFAPVAILFGLPLCAFVAASARVGAQRRAERLSALRLVGMTAGQVRRAAAFEAGIVGITAAVAGTIVGACIVKLFSFDTSDVVLAFAIALPITIIVVTLISAVVAFIGLARVEISPLGVQVPRRLRRTSIVVLAVLWVLATVLVVAAVLAHSAGPPLAYVVLSVAFLAAMTRRGVIRRIGRVMTQRARRLPALVSGRRLERDPQVAARGLGVLALMFFIVSFVIVNNSSRPASADTGSVPRASQPDFHLTTQLDNSYAEITGSLHEAAPSGSIDVDGALREIAALPGTRVQRIVDVPVEFSAPLSMLVGTTCDLPDAPSRCTPAPEDAVIRPEACPEATAVSPGCTLVPGLKVDGAHPGVLSAREGDARMIRGLRALGADGVITPAAAHRIAAEHAIRAEIWAPKQVRRQIAEIVVRRPGLQTARPDGSSSTTAKTLSGIVLMLFVIIPIASSVAIGAGDRSYSRRRSLAASWAVGVPRNTLRRTSLLEVAIPLVYVTVTSTAAGIALGWITHGGAPESYAPWAAIGFVVTVGLLVWLAATAAIAPMMSRTSAERALRTT